MSHLLGVSDVNTAGFCKGGVTLKMMDECGGIAAMRHCQTAVVTVSIEATNFHERVPKGKVSILWDCVLYGYNTCALVSVVGNISLLYLHYCNPFIILISFILRCFQKCRLTKLY